MPNSERVRGEPRSISDICQSILSKLPPPLTPEEEQQRQIAQELRDARERRDRLCGVWNVVICAVGSRYKDCSLDNFVVENDAQRKAVAAIREYVANSQDRLACGSGIVLYGPPGTGKDHLAVAAVREIIRGGCDDVRWINGLDFFGTIRDRMDSRDSEADFVRGFTRPKLLMVSDPIPVMGELGSHQASMLFRIVDDRYRNQRPTIVTMNATNGAEAAKRIGGATVDRLRDGSITIHCNWPSHRRAFGA